VIAVAEAVIGSLSSVHPATYGMPSRHHLVSANDFLLPFGSAKPSTALPINFIH
jgi:hypothetical protein